MFRRLVHEHWHDLVPVITFVLTFLVFLTAMVRALLARGESIQRMALLPLETADPPGAGRKPCGDGCIKCPVCRHAPRKV